MRRQQLREPEKAPETVKERVSTTKPTKKPKGDRKLQEKAATVPHNPVNEMVVIAAALVDAKERKRLVRLFTSDFFYAPGHSSIWNVVEELDRKGLGYDPATIEQLSNDEIDTNYLDDLIRERPEVPPNLQHHVDQIVFDRKRIELAKGPLSELLDKLHDPTTDPDEYIRVSRQIGGWFDGAGSSKFLREASDVQIEMERELDADVKRHREGCGIYPFGIDGLDFMPDGKTPRLTPGAAPGLITLLVGASGSGKTTIANQAVLAFLAQGRRVLHAGWEVKDSMNLRMFAGFSLGMSRKRLWTGNLTDEELRAVKEEARRIWDGDHPLLKFMRRPFDQETSKSAKKNRRYGTDYNLDQIEEHIDASGAEVMVIDLFHKAIVDAKPEEEKRALDRLQAIADRTQVHFLNLHHVTKADIQNSEGHRPTRNSLKGSSAWLDSSDNVFGTHNPAMWKRIPNNTLEIIILKQKYEKGQDDYRIEFDYDAETGLIRNGREVDAGFDDEESLDDSLANALNEGKRR